jgi:ABC-type Fe3+ transport system permease subunit
MKNSLSDNAPAVLGTRGSRRRRSSWLRHVLLLLALVLPVLSAAAQNAVVADTPEMADVLRASGKIYVVVAVIAVVLAGLLALLVSLDRKVSRLEREMKDVA